MPSPDRALGRVGLFRISAETILAGSRPSRSAANGTTNPATMPGADAQPEIRRADPGSSPFFRRFRYGQFQAIR